MPCADLPAPPPAPDLPAGISLDPSLSIPSLPDELCCKTFDMPAVPPLTAFPAGTFNPALAQTIDAVIAGVVAHCQGRPLNCPKE